MSTLRVTAEQLTIHPHPDADRLELAQVGLYNAVVRKGQYSTGDWAIYIPEGTLVPDGLLAELNLTGKLAGPFFNRVKAVRLRGELSQGIVCSPRATEGLNLPALAAEGHDFADMLSVTKWIPAIPAHLSGDVEAAPDLIRWIEIDDIKRFPGIFEEGEPVVATEKIHGVACLTTWTPDRLFVSSKGSGADRLALIHDPENLYWRAVTAHNVAGVARRIAEGYGARRVGIFGEVYGGGIQDLEYNMDLRKNEFGYAAYDIAIDVNGTVRWLDYAETRVMIDGLLPMVPELYDDDYDYDTLTALATGVESVSGAGAHLREGIVVRPVIERYSPITTDGRTIAKFINPAYLTRKNGTEYT